MSLHQLRRVYEKRKQVLTSILNKDRKLDKARREQLVGAISEIDTMLKTIDAMRDDEINESEKLGSKIQMTDPGIFQNINFVKRINEKIRSKFDNSTTKKDLANIFVRKCDTRTRYEFFASKAREEGYESVAEIFNEFAEHEKQHAMIIFKHLNMDETTFNNIRDASDIENHFHQKLYVEYENTAKQESFSEIAEMFKELSEIEAEHEKKFLRLLKVFHENKVFKSDIIVKWKCRNCGYMTESREAPKKCTVCKKSQAFFEVHKD